MEDNTATPDAATQAYQQIAATLDDPALKPDPEGASWASQKDRLDDLWRRVEHDLVPGVRAAYREKAAEPIPPGDVAGLLLEMSALFAAARESDRARKCLDHADSLAPDNHPLRELIDGARSDPGSVHAIILAQWEARHRDVDAHDKVLRRALKAAKTPAMKTALERMLDGPRPVKSAPSLFTLNGFGTMLYGSRDPRNDGSYVATRFFTALFVPLVPIDAWRVRPADGNSYYFLAKEPLSKLVKNFRRAALGAMLALGVASPVQAWYASPTRGAERALGEAAAAVSAHHEDDALRRYQSIASTYVTTSPQEAQRAAAEVMRIVTGRVPRPATMEHAPRIQAALRSFEALPPESRSVDASRVLSDAASRWNAELGDATLAALQLRGALIHALQRTAFAANATRWREAEVALEGSIVARLSTAWPIDALDHIARSRSTEAAETLRGSVEAILRSSSSTRFAATALGEWVNLCGSETRNALRSRITEGVAAARARDEDGARRAALQSGDRAALATLAATDPGDQEVAVAIASADFASGDEARRAAVINALDAATPFGIASADAQSVRVAMMFAVGRGEEASRLVAELAEIRMPAMRAVSTELRERQETLVQSYLSDARQGGLPADISARLRAAPENEQSAIFRAWVGEQLGRNQALRDLVSRRERHNPLIGMVLARGRWMLRQANERSGAARQELLEQTRKVFLSVSTESDERSEYRLAMGQVEHQLGRPREGDALLQQVLEGGSTREKIEVSGVYRELGLLTRAREIADRTWESASDPQERFGIAGYRSSFPASLDDLERWLDRSDPNDLNIRIRRKTTQASRALQDGRAQEADRLLVEARALYRPDMLQSSAGANNAAILEQERFACTGDIARLQAAVDGLETALRRTPENATVLRNLCHPLQGIAMARVLDPELRLRALRLGRGEISEVVQALSAGPDGARVQQTLAASASLRRSGELAQQLETIAPSSPETWGISWHLAGVGLDQAAIDALVQRLSRVAHIDAADSDRDRALNDSPEERAEAVRTARAQREDAERIVTAARGTSHPPTLAVAYMIRASRRSALVAATGDYAEAQGVVDDYRAAMQTWDRLELRPPLAQALVVVAVGQRASGDPAFGEAFTRDRRELGFALALHRALNADTRGALRAALAARPEVIEAATLVRAGDPRRVGIQTRMAFDALGLVPLQLDEPMRRWFVANDTIERRLDPHDPSRAQLDPVIARLSR